MSNVTWIGVNKKEITDENIQKVEQYFNIKFYGFCRMCKKI